MGYKLEDIALVAEELKSRLESLEIKADILKAVELRDLLSSIKDQPNDQKAEFGAQVNNLKNELRELINQDSGVDLDLDPIDVTAPFDVNIKDKRPTLMGVDKGSKHPITTEINLIKDIFIRMGFNVEDSRQVDDDYHMFESLNFAKDHPARDDYDTFSTEEGLLLPAHTSTMQNRILKKHKPPIRAVIPGRVFRNEDVDSTHEHTFNQVEGVYVDQNINLGHMLGTIKTFLSEYFEEEIEYKTQPFYFPFVEPGLEYLIKMPKILRKSAKDSDKWMEIMGCGMIHPNVLSEGGIDPKKYSGFAWGMGVERMVMLKHGIEDIRLFQSGNLDFLKKFGTGQ